MLRLVERDEIARALQVVGNDPGDTHADIALAGKIGDGNRHRLESALAQVDDQFGPRRQR